MPKPSTTIVHDGCGYYRATKDEKFKTITLEATKRTEGFSITTELAPVRRKR